MKALIQAIGASLAGRECLQYFTLDDEEFSDELEFLFEEIALRQWTVGDVWGKLGALSS